MERFYSLGHSSIDFYFKQSARDFVVEEIPLYEFSGEGEHLILLIRKKNLSTFEMIDKIASALGIKSRDIGYAGMKDKHAMTKQYISINRMHEEKLENFSHDGIKIISRTYHNNKLRIGHLKGNRFYIKVKKVNPTDAQKIDEALKNIANFGMPNFFGYQRFGRDGDNYIDGEKIAKGEKKERNHKIKKLLISSYQSHLFNQWLNKRLEINTLVNGFQPHEIEKHLNMSSDEVAKLKAQKHPFKLLDGDTMEHYPHGRLFDFDGNSEDLERFDNRDITVTGLLCGKKARCSSSIAYEIEKEFDEEINADGTRRFAWVYPTDVEGRFNKVEAQYEFNFTLPKGCYATILLEEIAKKKIN